MSAPPPASRAPWPACASARRPAPVRPSPTSPPACSWSAGSRRSRWPRSRRRPTCRSRRSSTTSAPRRTSSSTGRRRSSPRSRERSPIVPRGRSITEALGAQLADNRIPAGGGWDVPHDPDGYALFRRFLSTWEESPSLQARYRLSNERLAGALRAALAAEVGLDEERRPRARDGRDARRRHPPALRDAVRRSPRRGPRRRGRAAGAGRSSPRAWRAWRGPSPTSTAPSAGRSRPGGGSARRCRTPAARR